MLIAKITLLLAAMLNPSQSAAVTATLLGAPTLSPALLKICTRESRCSAVKLHSIDVRLSHGAYRNAAAVGWLDPECQPPDPGAWATRGAFGIVVAFHMRYLPPCADKEYFDVPFVSAFVAGMKLIDHCGKSISKRHPATSRWAKHDILCRRIPRHYSSSTRYRVARRVVGRLFSLAMGKEAPKQEERRDARELPRVEPPTRKEDEDRKVPRRERIDG